MKYLSPFNNKTLHTTLKTLCLCPLLQTICKFFGFLQKIVIGHVNKCQVESVSQNAVILYIQTAVVDTQKTVNVPGCAANDWEKINPLMFKLE